MKTYIKLVVALVAIVLSIITIRPVSAAADKATVANILDRWSGEEKNSDRSSALKIGAKALRNQPVTDSEKALALKELREYKMSNPAEQEYITLVQTALEGGVTSTPSAPPVSKTVLATPAPTSATPEEISAAKAIIQSKIGSKDFRSHNHALKSEMDTNALGVAMEEGLIVLNGGSTKEDKALVAHILTKTAEKAEQDLGSMSRLHPDYAECKAVGKAFRVAAAMVAGSGLTISSSPSVVPVTTAPAPAAPAPVTKPAQAPAKSKGLSGKPATSKSPAEGHQGKSAKAPSAPATK